MVRRGDWILCALPFVALIGCTGPREPRHVVLITLDTTRADTLGCYGSAVQTPHIDRLAREGILFRSASTAATTTLAAHTSLLTGTWPQEHGVVRNGYEVSEANRMLAEVLSEAGFTTAGFVSSFALDQRFGFAQGFEEWDQDFDLKIRPGDPEPNQRRAENVVDAALDFLDGFAGDRLFLFVHFFDPHLPYDPPPPYRDMYGPIPESVRGDMRDVRQTVGEHQSAILGVPRGLDANVTDGLLPELIEGCGGEPQGLDSDLARLYAGEVSYMDYHLGRLIQGLSERGILEDALLVLTADHGETFWEHADFWNHGLAVYETTVHVPLVLRLPARDRAGLVVEEPVSAIDVFPTVLEALGMELPAGAAGFSLLARGGEAGDSREVFASATQPGASVERDALLWRNERKAQAVRSGRWKYVHTPYLEVEELFDLAADPLEQENLLRGEISDGSPERARADALRARLDAFRAEASPHPSEFFDDEKIKARLEALGYFEAGDTLAVNSPLQITNSSSALPDGTLGQPYAADLFASGEAAPYRWEITSGNLPEGLHLRDDEISGTPTAAGTFKFTATVRASQGTEASREFSITIH